MGFARSMEMCECDGMILIIFICKLAVEDGPKTQRAHVRKWMYQQESGWDERRGSS